MGTWYREPICEVQLYKIKHETWNLLRIHRISTGENVIFVAMDFIFYLWIFNFTAVSQEKFWVWWFNNWSLSLQEIIFIMSNEAKEKAKIAFMKAKQFLKAKKLNAQKIKHATIENVWCTHEIIYMVLYICIYAHALT